MARKAHRFYNSSLQGRDAFIAGLADLLYAEGLTAISAQATAEKVLDFCSSWNETEVQATLDIYGWRTKEIQKEQEQLAYSLSCKAEEKQEEKRKIRIERKKKALQNKEEREKAKYASYSVHLKAEAKANVGAWSHKQAIDITAENLPRNITYIKVRKNNEEIF